MIAIPATTIWRARRPRRSVSGVGGAFAVAARISIAPICVRGPVSQTSARARPRVTPVPAKIIDACSASGVLDVDRLDLLGDGKRLARERRLVDLERARLDEARVGRDPLAFADEQDVAGNHLLRRKLPPRPVAHDERGLGERLRERQDRAVGARFLPESERAVQHEDRRDRDPLARVADRHRDHGCDDQQRHQRIEQLVQREPEIRRSPATLRRVRPYRSSRRAASSAARPRSGSVPRASATSAHEAAYGRSVTGFGRNARRAPSTSPDGRPVRRRCRALRGRGGHDCRPRRGRWSGTR